MTVDEIKETVTMSEVIKRYGIIANKGMAVCPFHNDKNPSMKVYQNNFFCFSCGAHGDIFDFVRMMENVAFKEAFQILGGEYQKPTFSSRLTVYRAQKRREMRLKEEERLSEQRRLNNMLISIYRRYMDRSEPLSDVWCDCYNALQYQLYEQAELGGIEARW